MSNRKYIISPNQRFTRLVTISKVSAPKGTALKWLCRCDCGTLKVVSQVSLGSGVTLSCGCLHSERLSQRLTKHGFHHTREYRIWNGMKMRCDPKTTKPLDIRYYVNKGIRVCERWRTFMPFWEDMGKAPTPKHSIDRIDGNGHYSCGKCAECITNDWPMNCRWATQKEQTLNMARSVQISFNGETKSIGEWVRITGLKRGTLVYRLKHWPIDRAFAERPHR